MLAPFLVVGIGGSGGKTLQTMRDDLTRLLQQRGWSGPLPQAWQLLQIDTPSTPGEHEPDLPAPMTGDSYLGLTSVNVGFDAIDQTLEQRLSKNALARQATAGWRPRADKVGVPVHKGAGQYRAIGRILAVTYIQQIKSAVERAISRMQGLSADSELRRAADCLGQTADGPIGAPTVIIVSSIAGGTGAGMLIDICDVVRLLGHTWTDDSFGILYTPEVFDDLPVGARQGIRPNAFAALSEVLAGFWDKDGFADDESALLEMAGVNTMGTTRIGPRYPFLVGQSNGQVRFASQNDVYRATGRALSAWVTSEKLQTSMSSYLSGNWASSAGATDNIPFKEQSGGENQESPFQALGFGRVSLGRDRFLQYSSELLARRTIDRLKQGHMEGVPHNDHRAEELIIKQAVDQEWSHFLTRTQLDLGGSILEGDKEIRLLDKMRSLQIGSQQVNELAETIQRRLNLDASGQYLDSSMIIANVEDQLRNSARGAQAKYRMAAESQIQQWVEATQTSLLSVCLETAAYSGIPVTIQLLDRLASHMAVVRNSVMSIVDSRRRMAMAAPLPPDQAMPTDSDQVASFVRGHARLRIAQADAEVLEGVGELIDDLKSHLIIPLRKELRGILEEINSETDASWRGPTTSYVAWPTDKNVPKRVLPTQNERLLLDPTQFYSKLLEILSRQLSAARPEEAIDRAIRELVLYSLDGPNAANVVEQLWVPIDPSFRKANAMGEKSGRNDKISLDLSLSPSSMLQRSEEWLSRRDTLMGGYVNENLSDYFNERKLDDREELEKRVKRFGLELAEAIKASDPLVSVNAGVASLVHPNSSRTPGRQFNGFPFPLDSRAGKQTDTVLQTATGMEKSAREKLFGVDHHEPYVDVFSYLGTPMEAPVFDSLMKPLAEEWAKARAGGTNALSSFWRLRRTRPLPQFVPMSPYVRQAMVRGWFTAHLLGQVSGAGMEQPIQIFIRGAQGRKGAYGSFPHPLLLPEGYGPADRIAGILKTAMVALVAVNSSQSLAPVEPYRRLLDLGTTQRGSIQSYDQVTKELADWVLDGAVANGAPMPSEAWSGLSDGTPEERKSSMIARLQSWMKEYEFEIFAPVDLQEDLSEVPRAWEMRRDYISALHQLKHALTNLSLKPPPDVV